jgi:glycosyltransferase involved in cell wall biosynthesis
MIGDGPLRPAVEAAIAQRQAPVRLGGFLNQSRIAEAYVAADVLVLPSDGGETWGLVVNEAMACGRPALVSDAVGCAPDLVHDGQTGYRFACGAVDQLAARVAQLAADPAAVTAFGQAARARVADYSVERAVAGTCDALAELAHARRRMACVTASAPTEI